MRTDLPPVPAASSDTSDFTVSQSTTGRVVHGMCAKCILVAEDDPHIRRDTVRALRPFGYLVLEAVDGREALELFSQHVTDIDLLITNVRMPRMDGHELARQIKQLRPDVRVLIVSGQHEREFPAEATHHSDSLLKPFEPKALVDKVQRLLSTPITSRQLNST
jgi:two-component system, cell cycle sensor histidine kinase and response regulator CckA